MAKDIAASVHQRLLKIARTEGQSFNELFQYFVIERFLYRLSKSQYVDHFVLKGALLFRVWMSQDTRATRDIDFLAFGDNTVEGLVKLVSDVISRDIEEDGLVFDPTSIEGQIIKEGADYEGVRILCDAFLDKAKSRLQLDIAFGDTVYPEPKKERYPTLLDHPAPVLRLYPPETVFAEKLEAMINLGALNSRMKDFYDIWRLMQHGFDGEALYKAVSQTIISRSTEVILFSELEKELNESPDKQLQWTAFLGKSQVSAPESFDLLLQEISVIASPVLKAVLNRSEFDMSWKPGGPWKEK